MKTKKRINPIKKGLLMFALFFSVSLTHAQQWIDEKYQYDSLLNVPYGTAIDFNGGIDTLKMDIYTPICDDINHISRRPLMIFIHGGGFRVGDKNNMTEQCKQFAKKGYVTATIDYRLEYVINNAFVNCNLIPNDAYKCLFAADSAEWYRAYFRAVQDGKGALRYLINRNTLYRIDTNNVFIVGESAGSFTALGVGLLDTIVEKPIQAGSSSSVPAPGTNPADCYAYNFTNPTIIRPDLGSIDGTIEPTDTHYVIKGIGNFYGAMFEDLLKYQRSGVPKPAIFSFHQPCDLIVPIDSAKIYQGYSWCLGYCWGGCLGIAYTPKIYGSRAFSNWNTNNGYGYNIHDEFTSIDFPGVCAGSPGSCLDQAPLSVPFAGNNPCHDYDSKQTRLNNMAQFFAPMITTSPICDTLIYYAGIDAEDAVHYFHAYPNPATESIIVDCENYQNCQVSLYNVWGDLVQPNITLQTKKTEINIKEIPAGIYLLYFRNSLGKISVKKIIKK